MRQQKGTKDSKKWVKQVPAVRLEDTDPNEWSVPPPLPSVHETEAPFPMKTNRICGGQIVVAVSLPAAVCGSLRGWSFLSSTVDSNVGGASANDDDMRAATRGNASAVAKQVESPHAQSGI